MAGQRASPDPDALDLALESLLELSDLTGLPRYREHVAAAVAGRGWAPGAYIPLRDGSIASLDWALYWRDKNRKWLPNFMNQSRLMKQFMVRGDTGVLVRAKPGGAGEAVMLDWFLGYIVRCARMAYLTGDPGWTDELHQQFQLHMAALRDPATRFWRSGKGWGDNPAECSPGAWSVAQGRLVCALAEVVRHTPPTHQAYPELRLFCADLVARLASVQDGEGYWHAIVDLPQDRSPVESAGTGLIAYGMARLAVEGVIPHEPASTAARRAARALRMSVGPDGTPLDASPAPGPLVSLAPYTGPIRFEPGDLGGVSGLIYGFCADLLLAGRKAAAPSAPMPNAMPTHF